MMGDPGHFQPAFILNTMKQILPSELSSAEVNQLLYHMNIALNTEWAPLALNNNVIEQTRVYFAAMPAYQLGNIILKTMNSANNDAELNLTPNTGNIPAFISDPNTTQMLPMFTARAFPVIINQDSVIAAREALTGNWILGDNLSPEKNPAEINTLIEQLRTAYVNSYIAAWEGVLNNIRLTMPSDLAQTDNMIVTLLGTNSPLLQVLQTIHDNTYFDPVATYSGKLQSLGLLLENRNQAANQLYQIFTSLQYLHEYLQAVLSAQDERKAAFIVVSNRMLSRGTPDAITQLRLIASRAPDPVRIWLDSVANSTWHYLMLDASNYIDISWQNQVIQLYQNEIANRYPFNTNTEQEVAIQHFVNFFGNPGAVPNFYNVFLRQFVDSSTPEWRWKVVDNLRLPFPEDTLRQIQYAMRIHHTFFPNDDNKMFVEFSIQPYQLDKRIKSVKLNINDKQFVDEHNGKNTHVIVWPYVNGPKMTSIQLTLANRKVISQDFSGDWGWFKLLNQSFENIMTHKEILLNLSRNEQPAKYVLFTNGQYNPFMTLNLNHFHLPKQLGEIKA
jgi:type VI protein secretion system component VasK